VTGPSPHRPLAHTLGLVLFVVSSLATPVAAQQVWHVASGSAGDGSAAAPFGRIQQAMQAAQPGDTVLVAPGTYAELVATVRSGGPALPITLSSARGRGSVVVSRAGQVLQVSHADVVIDGLVFDGQYAATDAVRVSSGGDRLVLRNAEVRRSGRDCIDMVAPDDVLIEQSLIHRCLWWDGTARQDAHGIVAGPAHGLTVREVEIHTFSGDAIQLDPGRSLPGWDDVLIEDSRFWLAPLASAENGFAKGVVPGENAIDTKIQPDAPRASMVIRNTVASGFRDGFINNMAAFNLKERIDVTLDGVTVSDSQVAFRLRGPGENGGAWVRLRNVVVHDVATAIRYEDRIEQVEVSHATFGAGVSRVFQAVNSGWAGVVVRNSLVLGGALPTEAPAGERNLAVASQAFEDAATHDYRLASTTAVDAGAFLDGIATDRLGAPRVQGPAPDLGAYERAIVGAPGPTLSVTLNASDPTNAVRLSWTNVTGESGYEIARSADGRTYARVATTVADKTTWSNSRLVSGATYWYQVRAITDGIAGAYSAPARITLAPELAAPSAPGQLSVRLSTSQPTTGVVLSWQDTSLNEDGFHVERSTDGVTFSRISTRSVNTTKYANGGLVSGQLYWYRIRSFNTLGSSAWTVPVSIRTQ
jgi:hypothetical protein